MPCNLERGKHGFLCGITFSPIYKLFSSTPFVMPTCMMELPVIQMAQQMKQSGSTGLSMLLTRPPQVDSNPLIACTIIINIIPREMYGGPSHRKHGACSYDSLTSRCVPCWGVGTVLSPTISDIIELSPVLSHVSTLMSQRCDSKIRIIQATHLQLSAFSRVARTIRLIHHYIGARA